MRILYVTTIGATMHFFPTLIRRLLADGHIVDIATNQNGSPVQQCYTEMGCRIFQIDWTRTILNKGNVRAIFQLKKIVAEGQYDLVHCHTPIASACTRIACRKFRKNGLKVFYTAHGFHFYKGAPLKNWLVYYPVEKICSYFTDTLITINREDYEFAKRKMKAKRIEYVPGVGIDVDKFKNVAVNRDEKRKELGIPVNAFLLISVGELNKNKNHEIVIRALAKLGNPNIHYMIAGTGSLRKALTELVNALHVEKQVHLLGARNDVELLYNISDVDVFPSIREGLGLVALEGMASGLPLICSDNRGTREYAVNGVNAIVCQGLIDYEKAIEQLFKSRTCALEMGRNGREKSYHFSIDRVNSAMLKNYNIEI